MHAALREVLGTHVQQKGSLVDADKTRFDFSHQAPMTADQIRAVEARVNAEILGNAATQAQVMAFDDAVAHGAMALFGEKYGDRVRVLDIGSSRELCGGTHVSRTGDIGQFKIVGEGGVAAGIRRVEAVTGDVALSWVQGMETALQGAAAAFKAPMNELSGKIEQLLDAQRVADKEIARLKSKLAASQGDELAAQAVKVKDLNLLTAVLEGADARTLRETLDKLKDKLRPAVVVLAAVADGKVQLAAGVSADVVGRMKAGELVNFVAQQVGGKGGGKPDMAMAGGSEPKAVPAALASVQAWVSERA
jgi:alanyl-tRNA synthetase